jgi:hypothetical protein
MLLPSQMPSGLPLVAAATAGIDPSTIAVFAVSAAIVGWYFVGVRWNRRLGRRAAQWLRSAWPEAGEGQVRWVSGSQMQIGWDRLPTPWRRLVATVMLEPREGLLAWGYRWYRGHRDMLVVRGHLSTPPRREGEVDLAAAASASEATPLSGALRKLVLHRTGPHVACELELSRALARPAGEVMGAVAALGASAAADDADPPGPARPAAPGSRRRPAPQGASTAAGGGAHRNGTVRPAGRRRGQNAGPRRRRDGRPR